tara:strand:+ start:282 stop:1151 length:870 start_codon:yes stop_codon:yes gene_type:complete
MNGGLNGRTKMKNTMKKIGALFVLSIFIVGMVPAAFAVTLKEFDTNAKAKYSASVTEYKNWRGEYKQTANLFRSYIKGVKNKEDLTLSDAGEVQIRLSNFIQDIIDQLDDMKSGVKNSCIDNDRGIAYLNEVQQKAKNLKAEVDAWDPTTSKNPRKDLNGFLRKISSFWNEELKGTFYHAIARAGSCKAQHLLSLVDKMIDRLNAFTANAEAQGKDVDLAWELIADMESKRDRMYNDYENLLEAWGNVDNYQEAHNLMIKVNQHLKLYAKEAREIYSLAKRIAAHIISQ